MVDIANLIQILPGDLIQIPHCEPPSSVSTLRFAAYYAASDCAGGLISLADALAALPGSEVVFGVNFGPPNYRQKWLRLPPIATGCPCPGTIDFYGILRELRRVDPEPEPTICGSEVADWCDDAIDFDEPHAPNTYFEDGQFPSAVGHLPLIPPYAAS